MLETCGLPEPVNALARSADAVKAVLLPVDHGLDGLALGAGAGAAEGVAGADDRALVHLKTSLLALAEDIGWVVGHLCGEGEGGGEGEEDAECKELHGGLGGCL